MVKKVFLSLSVIIILFSCGNNESSTTSTTNNNTEQAKPAETNSDNPVYKKGLGLVAKSGCLTCHKIDELLTGPSYRDVAEKYAGASDEIIAELAQKIIKGGSGIWGSAIMIPHPGISKEDAEAMVRYILMLKK